MEKRGRSALVTSCSPCETLVEFINSAMYAGICRSDDRPQGLSLGELNHIIH